MAQGSHSQPVNRPVTRPRNANQHPGTIVAPRKRRTAAEKKKDDEMVSLVKKKVDEGKQRAVMLVASLKDAMAVDDGNQDDAHPRCLTAKSESSGAEEPPKKKYASAKDRKHGSQGKCINGNELQKGLPQEAQAQAISVGSEEENRPHKTVKNVSKATSQTTKAQSTRNHRKFIAVNLREEEEITTLGVGHKDQGVSKATKNKSCAKSVAISDIEEVVEDIATDVKEAAEPLLIRRGLKRSYAMLNVISMDTSDNDDPADPEFEAPSEWEESVSTGIIELYDDDETPKKKVGRPQARKAISAGMVKLDDEDETPKKKKKVGKPTMRETIKAIRGQASKCRQGPRGLAESTRTGASTTVQSGNGRTTASSSATWIKTVNSNDMTVSHGVTPEVGGFNDEDETEEREYALSSPIKGNTRLTSTGIIKVEHTSPPPIKRNGGRKDKYSNVDLPAGCQEKNIWRGKLIPTYIQYMSCKDTVWRMKDGDATVILQAVWDYLYGAQIPRKIVSMGPVFGIADQRLCEWRCAFGSAALMIINMFFLMKNARHSTEQLEGYNFLYKDVSIKKNGEPKRKGIFHGPLVLQTFAVHLTAIGGAVTVPSIGGPDNAKGALALSAAAVERGFTLWRDGCILIDSLKSAPKAGSGIIRVVNDLTGKTSSKSTDFNQANWSSVTSEYLAAIKANFLGKTAKFESLMKEAATFVQGKNSQRGNSSNMPSNLDDGISLGERAFLVEESGDDSEEEENE